MHCECSLVQLLSINTALLNQRSQDLNCVGILTLRPYVFLHITSESEGEFLPGHFVHDSLGVIVTKASTQLVVVHLRLVFLLAPQTSNLIWLEDTKLILVTGPVHHLTVAGRQQEVQEKLPELNNTSSHRNYRKENNRGKLINVILFGLTWLPAGGCITMCSFSFGLWGKAGRLLLAGGCLIQRPQYRVTVGFTVCYCRTHADTGFLELCKWKLQWLHLAVNGHNYSLCDFYTCTCIHRRT